MPADRSVDAWGADSPNMDSDGTVDAAIPDPYARIAEADMEVADQAVADALAEAETNTDAEAVIAPNEDATNGAGDAAAPVCGQGLPVGQAAYDQVVRSCVLAVSCDPFVFNENISACVTQDLFHSVAYYSCLSTINDCDEFYECWGQRRTTSVDCPATALGARCDSVNNLAIDCNRQTVENCTRFGGTCGMYADGTLVGCVVASSCPDTDGLLHCTSNGNILYTCIAGAGFGQNCTLDNATCNAFDGGSASCYFDGPSCDIPGYTCSEGVLTLCYAPTYRKAIVVNCEAQGLSCSTSPDGGNGACLAPGCKSLEICPVESCGPDGKTLTICVGGAPYQIDCSTLGSGFTSCATERQSSTGVVYGYCR